MVNDLKLKVFMSNYEDVVTELETRIDDIVRRYNKIVKQYTFNGRSPKPLLHSFYELDEASCSGINYTWYESSGCGCCAGEEGTHFIPADWLFDNKWEQELIDELKDQYNERKQAGAVKRAENKIAAAKKKKARYLKLKAEYGD